MSRLLMASILSGGSLALLALAAFILLAGIWLVSTYNQLTRARIRIENSWSQINVQLKMRADLIPNLVQAVSGYARHEQSTLNQIMDARTRYLSSRSPESAMQSSGELGTLMGRLFAVAEQYPDLKADASYQQLQQQLAALEQKIALARQLYNDTVMIYNRKTELFPSRIAASLFGFKSKPYFEVSQADQQLPEVRLP